ncbi:lipase domain-containing protein [Cyclospora cayetanensis]|uniref:Lipase domain-containing protein n=1 Tax=Cyclospora cayetanensis TaxID=88456 RepID=A0A1D3D4K8_9EIME|nr:lipase domain-containing protein [Cyclospora cayetanensis]
MGSSEIRQSVVAGIHGCLLLIMILVLLQPLHYSYAEEGSSSKSTINVPAGTPTVPFKKPSIKFPWGRLRVKHKSASGQALVQHLAPQEDKAASPPSGPPTKALADAIGEAVHQQDTPVGVSPATLPAQQSGGESGTRGATHHVAEDKASLNVWEQVWEPLTIIAPHKKLFSVALSAEDPILVDHTHRPHLPGLHLGPEEVKELNNQLSKELCPIQLPEFAQSPLVASNLEDKSARMHEGSKEKQRYVVPMAQRQASSWWHKDRPFILPSQQTWASSASPTVPPASDTKDPSGMNMLDVMEIFDMSGFGVSALFHPEAFEEHLHCEGFYPPLFLRSKPLSPWAAACSFKHFSAFAEKVAKLATAHASTANSSGVPQAKRVLSTPAFLQHAPSTVDPPSSDSGYTEEVPLSISLLSALEAAGPSEGSNRKLENTEGGKPSELLGEDYVEAPEDSEASVPVLVNSGPVNNEFTSRWWHGLLTSPVGPFADRRNVAGFLLQVKGSIWHEVMDAAELAVPVVALTTLQKKRGTEPVMFALSSALLNCRAHLPYRQVGNLGMQTVPFEAQLESPLVDFFNRHRASVDLPLEMTAPQKIFVDGRHYAGEPKKRRINRVYFRSVLVLWQFAFHAYRISDQFEDYARLSLPKLLFKHWVPTYVGTALLTHNGKEVQPGVDRGIDCRPEATEAETMG